MSVIEWPWQYNFPPFFTLQPHEETRVKQLNAWKHLVLEYLKVTKQAIIDVREVHSSPLFNNSAIDRKLSPETVLIILEELQKSGNCTPLDKSKQRWLVYWHTLDEWSDIIYGWAQNSGFTGSVCTFFELTDGDDTTDQEFHGLDNEILMRALTILQNKGRVEIIGTDGVKFF